MTTTGDFGLLRQKNREKFFLESMSHIDLFQCFDLVTHTWVRDHYISFEVKWKCLANDIIGTCNCKNNKTTTMQSTDPSSDDDSGVRHDFSAYASLQLTISYLLSIA